MNFGMQDQLAMSTTRVSEQQDIQNIIDTFQQFHHSNETTTTTTTSSINKNNNKPELDCARFYLSGNTEDALGHLTNSNEFTIATKVWPIPKEVATGMLGYQSYGFQPKCIREQVERSLKALKRTTLDILYLHWPDPDTNLETTLDEINQLFHEEKFHTFGLSNFPAYQVVQIINYMKRKGYTNCLPKICQYPYNCIARTCETEMMRVVRDYDLKMYAYNPLAGGLLTDKYESILLSSGNGDGNVNEPPVESSIPTGRFSGNGSQATRYRERYFNQRNFEALSIISNACKAKNITMVDATLRWMLHHSKLNDKLDGIIIGCSSTTQLKQSMECMMEGKPLDDELLNAIEMAYNVVHGTELYYSRTGDKVAKWSSASL